MEPDHTKAEVAKRKQFITEMKQFIDKECAEIGEVLSHLSWTPDHIVKSISVTKCPHDSGHQMPESSLKQHASVCQLRKMGLSTQEAEIQLQNDDVFFKNADLVGKVKLDEALLNRILWNHSMEHRQVHMGHRSLPQSTDDWWVKLSAQDRLAIYEYCVQTLKTEGKMANVEKDEVLTTDWEKIVKKGLLEQGGQKPTSQVELLAMLRDQKRRRQSYRAKNVHVTKKSYTEIIREVIQNQMEIMMPSGEIKKEQQEDADPAQGDKDSDHHRHHDRSVSQTKSRTPRRQRNRSRSRSPGGWRYHDSWERRGSRSPSRRRHDSRSPQRSRSRTRSRSPQERSDTTRSRWEEESSSSGRARGAEDEKMQSHDRPSRRDEEYEEGQIESDDSSSRHKGSHSKKKSSKHKKHKHKKHKSKSYHSDSD